MTAAARKPEPRGACPGALRPMQSGDGLIVRVRPHAGALSVASLVELAQAASRLGNAEIDLTRRANLQLRGLDASGLNELQELLSQLGLLDETPEAESVRNIVVSPLAGLDPSELVDVRETAHALVRIIASESGLWTLPPKFGFLLDGGGRLALDDERADIRLRAIDRAHFALGVDSPNGTRWLGSVSRDKAPAAVARAASIFAGTLTPGTRSRMRKASEETRNEIAATLAPLTELPAPRPADRPLGLIDLGDNGVAAAFGMPFGRMTAGTVRAVANAAHGSGAAEIRLSPWRALYVPLADRAMARAVLASAARLNLVTIEHDPIAAIDACPGYPACASAFVETRKVARRLASMWPGLGIKSAHVSGCAKGCARSAKADLVLVGGDNDFGIVRNGRADDTPQANVSSTLEDLPSRLRNLTHG